MSSSVLKCLPNSTLSEKPYILDEHALIGVSPFNSYFSVENMEKLFSWAQNNFTTFDIFFMDEASVFNLMAIGYDEQKALDKTRKHDRNLGNKIVKSLINSGYNLKESEEKILFLSKLSKSKKYYEIYNKFTKIFEKNSFFRKDCLRAT